MTGSEGISVADALALQRNNSNGNDNGWGGSNGAWWIIILILFFAVGGWGRGFGGNNGGNGGVSACSVPATSQGMTDAFNFSQLDNGIRGLEQGLCNGFYTTAQNINTVAAAIQQCCCETQQSILTLGTQIQGGFNGVEKSIMTADFHNQSGFNGISNQLSSCCCDIERGQDAMKYEMSQLASQLLVENDKNTDRIINHLTQTEMQNLRNQVEEYRSQLQIATQTANIVGQLMPVAKPAYITCSPYASAFGYPGFQNFQNFQTSACGCY